MRYSYFSWAFVFVTGISAGLAAQVANASDKEKPRVAVLLTEGFQDAEALSPVFYLRELGVEPVIIGLQHGLVSAYNSEVRINVQKAINEVSPEEFVALVIPGGQSPATLREDSRVIEFVKAIAEAKKPVAAICHGPQVLARAGLLDGLRAAAFPGIAEEVKAAGGTFLDQEVVIDGTFITSRLPKDIPAFNTALGEMIKKTRG